MSKRNADPIVNLNFFIEIKMSYKLFATSYRIKYRTINVIKLCLFIEIKINVFACTSKRSTKPLVNIIFYRDKFTQITS